MKLTKEYLDSCEQFVNLGLWIKTRATSSTTMSMLTSQVRVDAFFRPLIEFCREKMEEENEHPSARSVIGGVYCIGEIGCGGAKHGPFPTLNEAFAIMGENANDRIFFVTEKGRRSPQYYWCEDDMVWKLCIERV